MDLLKPKEIRLKDLDGENEKTYILSRIPAWPAREICTQWPISALPKIGDYRRNEELAKRLISYVAVVTGEGEPVRLVTDALVHNHVPDWETLIKLETAMLEYNSSFRKGGWISNSLEGFTQKALALVSKTLTDSWAQSSQAGKPPSTNSEQSTT